ncbi:MAG TPA: PilN domain-containing protein [Solirubrobacteraceae bacterium]|jgi:Tfp pilus assembly protein PilN
MRAVNLIPSEQRSGGTVGARSGGAAFLVLGLLGGLAVLALLYGRSHSELQSRRAEAATLTARAQQVQAQAAQLAPYAAFMTLREQRLHSIAQLIGGRFDWPAVMNELSRVLPSNVSLNSMQGTVGAPSSAASSSAAATAGAVSSATPPGATPALTLNGCAASQATVAQMLVRLRLVNGVTDVALQSSTKSGGGGSSTSGAASSGTCPANDPTFAVQVSFEPLPTASTPSIQVLTASAQAQGTKHTAAALASGAKR